MSKARILVVEDEKIIQMDLQARLERAGYEVVGVASSGADAILKAGETAPDVVLMDIRLQGDMDGIQAAQQIRMAQDAPVVYLTALADIRNIGRAAGTEPYFYLVKPVRPGDLESMVNTACQLSPPPAVEPATKEPLAADDAMLQRVAG